MQDRIADDETIEQRKIRFQHRRDRLADETAEEREARLLPIENGKYLSPRL